VTGGEDLRRRHRRWAPLVHLCLRESLLVPIPLVLWFSPDSRGTAAAVICGMGWADGIAWTPPASGEATQAWTLHSKQRRRQIPPRPAGTAACTGDDEHQSDVALVTMAHLDLGDFIIPILT
jgi:hypothetical protein